jgi:hypothetical protein
MIITTTKFKSSIGKYLQLSQKEDILIMKNGKLISKLSKITSDDEVQKKLNALDRIAGFMEDAKELDIDKFREERIKNT